MFVTLDDAAAVVAAGKAFAAAEPSLLIARSKEALYRSTSQMGRAAVGMDSAHTFHRMFHILHFAAEYFFWHVHLRTSYRAVACRTRPPDPEHKLIYLIT